MDRKMGMILAFAAGIAVGMNYSKIRKVLNPYLKGAGEKTSDVYEGIVKFMADQKEKVEDIVAEMKHKKGKAAKVVAKRSKRKLATATAAA